MNSQPAVVQHPAAAVSADRRASAAEDFAEIARDLRASRSLIAQLTLRDIKVRYKQALMGFAWAILSPVLIIAAGVVVRLAIAGMSGRPLELTELTGIVVKGLGWGFVTGAIGFATTSLTGNSQLITKVYFPRETLPLSVVTAMPPSVSSTLTTFCEASRRMRSDLRQASSRTLCRSAR